MNNLEIEPLRVSLGVNVVFQPQIVLDVVDLDCAAEVPTLKARVKDQDVVLLRHIDSILMGGLPGLEICGCISGNLLAASEVSLRRELRQVLEHIFVELVLKVSLPRFLIEQFVCPCDLLRGKQLAEVDLFGRVLFKVGDQVLISDYAGK